MQPVSQMPFKGDWGCFLNKRFGKKNKVVPFFSFFQVCKQKMEAKGNVLGLHFSILTKIEKCILHIAVSGKKSATLL